MVCLLIVFYPKILFARGGSRVSSGLVDQRKIAPLAWGRPRVQIPTSPFLNFSFLYFSPSEFGIKNLMIAESYIGREILMSIF